MCSSLIHLDLFRMAMRVSGMALVSLVLLGASAGPVVLLGHVVHQSSWVVVPAAPISLANQI